MLPFLIICVILAVVVVLPLAHTIRRKRRDTTDLDVAITVAANQQNIEITRERLALLPDGPEFDDARQELEAALAEDLEDNGHREPMAGHIARGSRSAMVVVVLVPIAAALIYVALGDRTWVGQAGLPTAAEIRANPEASIEVLINRLEEALVKQPDNPAGWALAGQTYMSLGRYADAEKAYAEANRLMPDDADMLSAWADATLLVNDNDYDPVVAERIERALALNPHHVNALWIAGMGNLSLDNEDRALDYLERLLPLLSGQPQVQQQVSAIIDQVRGSAPDTPLDDNTRSVTVAVSIDPAIAASVPASQPVFVFARAPDGPPFPLAAARLDVADLPATVVLDESSAMVEGQSIATVDRVVITARVAMSGQPVAQPGDLTSDTVEAATNENALLTLEINRTVE